jgi:hypothetical protein
MYGVIFTIVGLGIDLVGAMYIVIPDLVYGKRISKKEDKVVAEIKKQKIDPVEKYRIIKIGVILLMIGFFVQIFGYVLPPAISMVDTDVIDTSSTWITGIATALLAGATALLAGFVLWQATLQKKQTEILQKQTQLASKPKIYPRFVHCICPCGVTYIRLYNVGKGNAIDIHLKFKDVTDKLLGYQIDRYSLLTVDIETPDGLGNKRAELIDTGIWFTQDDFLFKVEGWYRDTNEEIIIADSTYKYPPRREE